MTASERDALWREYATARTDVVNADRDLRECVARAAEHRYPPAWACQDYVLRADEAWHRLDAAVRALAAAPPAEPAVADGDVTLGIAVVQDAIPYHDSPAKQRALRALLRAVRQTDALRQIVREYKEGHGAAEGGVDSAGVAVDVDACRCALCEDARRALAAAPPAEPREREEA